MSEGAAIFVLESLEHALQRGARIYAEVAGYAANSDGYHVIAPNPDPKGSVKAIRHALADAGLEPQDVDYINAHGTGTPLGDAAETEAIKTVFGERAYEVPISDLDYVPHTARAAQVDVVLKNSFGMGNQNACVVLRRYDGA